MIAPVIVVFHEARQGALEFPRAKVLLELDDVLHRPVVAFVLSLRHGVIGRAPRMRQTVRVQVVGPLLRDVAWVIITKQPGPMDDPHTVHIRLTPHTSGHTQPVAPPVCGGRGADPRRLPTKRRSKSAAVACWGSWLAWMRSTTRSTCGSSRAAPAASMATRSPCSRNASLASVEVRNRSERGHAVSIACRVAEAFWRVLNRRRAPVVVVINEAVEKILGRRVPMALSSYSLAVLGAPGGTTDSRTRHRMLWISSSPSARCASC